MKKRAFSLLLALALLAGTGLSVLAAGGLYGRKPRGLLRNSGGLGGGKQHYQRN